jgi:putative phage-type endonuclease
MKNEDEIDEFMSNVVTSNEKQKLKEKKIKKEKKDDVVTEINKTVDDIITEEIRRRQIIVIRLLKIEFPEQRSTEWFEMRNGKITASDGGCVVGVNHYEPPYKFVMKKIRKPPFTDSIFTYHGKKYEKIANMIYSVRNNVKVEDFGLIAHPKCNFLAASPDGIVGLYKLDGIHKTKLVGRMLEIKCPANRKIKTEGKIYGEICPEYYWVQVQLQLQCCELDECDFWQCDIKEYSRSEYLADANNKEKGIIIQLLPRDKMRDIVDDETYNTTVYSNSSWLYPPRLDMTLKELNTWIVKSLSNLDSKFCLDRIIYWYLNKASCCTIIRDDKWYKNNLSTFESMWNYVQYLRKNKEKCEIVCNYIDNISNELEDKNFREKQELENKNNEDFMNVIKTICNEPSTDKDKIKKYNKFVIDLMEKNKK